MNESDFNRINDQNEQFLKDCADMGYDQEDLQTLSAIFHRNACALLGVNAV